MLIIRKLIFKMNNKITVSHYLNNKLKPELINEVEKFPLYIRVSANRSNKRMRSILLFGYYSEIDLLEKDNKYLIDRETKYIRFIIENENQNLNFDDLILLYNQTLESAVINSVTNLGKSKRFRNLLKSEIANYILSKTDLKISILNTIININDDLGLEVSPAVLREIDTKIINNEDLRNRINFYKLFIKFKEKYYKNQEFKYFEWLFEEGSVKFFDFINSVSPKEKVIFYDFYNDMQTRIYSVYNHVKKEGFS